MVFESLVADVLNKFLGDYVQNLDQSQLKIGIWGGDVVLQNLELNENALSEFDLPIRIIAGRLGKLILKIPWKSLYTSPVEAKIEGLDLLAVPNSGTKYDREKEEKAAKEAKAKELRRIEEAKQREAEKAKSDPAQDSFTEKLVSQIIKNLQVVVTDIHVRYEDSFTNPLKPFAFGLTLHNLSFETTDDQYSIGKAEATERFVFKLITLDSFSFYWNSNEALYSKLSPTELHEKFKNDIASSKYRPSKVNYVLGPINSTARLQLNPKPELDGSDYQIPKISLSIDMQEIALSLSKCQYQDIMELLQALERIAAASLNRKYHPGVPVKGHSRSWWKFAYNCIVEDGVRRRKKNWSWGHIVEHRISCRNYKDLYREKLMTKKLSDDLKKKIEAMEDTLDVFNITLARKQAEVEYARLGVKDKPDDSYTGWISSWMPWKKEKKNTDDVGLVKKFEEAMNSDEKSKLYDAIGYQENAAPAVYPKTFIETKMSFLLHNLTVTVNDESLSNPNVLKFCLEEVRSGIEMRPSAQAIKIEAKVGGLRVFGHKNGGDVPTIVQSLINVDSKSSCLLDVLIETNPLDDSCDQKVRVTAHPLEIVYHALSINQLIEVFKPPESINLSGLQEAAKSTLKDFNEKSAAGLQHAIATQKILDLKITLYPSYVIVPENGSFCSKSHVIVAEFGSLNIHSIARDRDAPNLYKLAREGSTESERLIAMREQSYDKFVIELTGMQILLAGPDEDWKAARCQDTSLHLLKPTDLKVELQKCVITDDPNLPKMKVKGRLPSFHLVLSDTKLLQLASVALSIPTPKQDEIEMVESHHDLMKTEPVKSISSNSKAAKQLATSNLPIEESQPAESVSPQVTNLELAFEIEKVGLTIIHKSDDRDVELFAFAILNLGVEMSQHPYDMLVNVYLGGLTVEAKNATSLSNGPLYIIRTPMTEGSTEKLFSLHYLNANKKGPEFSTVYRSIEQLIKVKFSKLNIVLHQEAILEALSLANDLQVKLDEIQKRLHPETDALAGQRKRRRSSIASSVFEFAKDATSTRTRKLKKKSDDIINMQLDASLDSFSLAVCTSLKPITDLTIKGLEAGVTIQKAKTTVVAKLQTITIYNPGSDAVYKQILSFVSGDAFDAKIIVFNDATSGAKYQDLTAVDTSLSVSVGCIRVVFLNKFVSEVMGFVNQFQAAKEKLIEASAAAAEAAKQNMQNMYQKAPRVQLKFKMKAPIIVIPQSSKSSNALVADLGHVNLLNTFKSGGALATEKMPIFDIIKIELDNLKLSRAILDPSTSVILHECPLLEPLSFNLNLSRNLTISWYKEEPEIGVQGKLTAVNLLMTQEDYVTTMLVLNENLSEGQSESQVESQKRSVKENTGGPLEVLIEADETTEAETIYKRVKFNFLMESFTIKLFSGSSFLEENIIDKRISNPLAKFELKMLAIKGEMSSDNSLWSNIVLLNCILDDTRTSRRGGITRLMEMVNGGRSMLDVIYRQEASGDKFLEVKVCSFMLVMCVEYLMSVGNFFTEGLPAESKGQAKPAAIQPAKIKPLQKELPKPPQAPKTNTTIKVKIEQPDIIVVEDIENIDSPGIIFNNEISLILKIAPECLSIMGQVTKLQLITCCYNPLKRASTMAEILSPCDICITSSTPFGEGMHLDVNISDIIIHVTPSVIQLLSSISSAFASKPAAVVDEQAVVVKDYSSLWQVQSLEESDFWFIKTEEAQDALESIYVEECPPEALEIPKRGEQLLVEIKTIILTLEAGSGSRTIPLVLLEASFSGEVRNWSSKLYVCTSFNMEVAYYNEKRAVYEPLIEPVDVIKESRPWELIFELKKNEDELPPVLTDEDTEEVTFAPANLSLTIISQDVLEMVVTKTALEVIGNLGKAFSEAISTNIPDKKELPPSPYTLKNESGLPIMLILKDQEFEVFDKQSENFNEVVLEADTSVSLLLKNQPSQVRKTSILKEQNVKDEHSLIIKITLNQTDVVRQLSVTRADKRYFPLPHRTYPGDQWGLVTEIISEYGMKTVLLRSNVQISNHFSVPVEAYYMTEGGNEVKFCGQVEPRGTLNLPLHAVYSITNEIFLRPKYNGYTVCIIPFVWKDLQKNPNLRKVLQCNPRENDGPSFFMNVIGEIEQVFYENTSKKTIASTCYNIHLHPTVVLCNQLPYPITYSLKGVTDEVLLEEGHSKELLTAELNSTTISIKIQNYLNQDWCCTKLLNAAMEEVWTFETSGASKQSLDLGVYIQCDGGFLHLSLYCPFWMLNKTGLTLGYRRTRKAEKNSSHGSPAKENSGKRRQSLLSLSELNDDSAAIITHPPNMETPIMFSFKPKVFFSKKKAALRVENSEWSDKFSLDTVGSSGSVTCNTKPSGNYQIGVNIRLTNLGVSKIVVFTPFYLIVNNASYDVKFREALSPDEWISLPAGQCLPFWPKHHLTNKELILGVSDTEEVTKPFTYNEAHTTLLALKNNRGGLNVDCQITEVSVITTISEYINGMATVCLINHCADIPISYMQSGNKEGHVLDPQKYVLYTWEDPGGQRELTWFCNPKGLMKNTLVKDGIGECDIDGSEQIYWVSFLNDTQRVLLFTDDLVLATNAQCANEFEKVDLEILLSLHGIGLSIINDNLKQEVTYIALASSGIIWESCKPNSQRYRPFNVKDCQILEAAFQKYSNELKLNKKPKKRQTLDNKMEVDFEEETLYRPFHRRVRRIFQAGLWAQYKTSPHQVHFHAKINRLQIDNQLDDCVFPTVLAPVPIPKSVAADTVPKPFTEASIILRKSEHSTVQQFKYFKVLVQEFHIKLDQSFINALIALFSQAAPSENKKIELFEQDQKVMKMDLKELAAITSSQEIKNFYDILHFSPLKVHISFSMQGGSSSDDPKKPTPIHSDFLNLLLQSVGVTLTEIQDVVFRLAFFEKQHVFITQRQLTNEAISHYTAQAIKQMYVLILGLDVIGNPFGLVMGLGKGLEDFFYEPFQGAVQGPEEFAEGLALGIKSLFGHAVGGAAGAVSRITGTLGKGVAALTMDEDYQRKRREAMNRRPANLQEGLARSGKGLVMGVFDGVTGVFVKPIEGAKQQGVEGFFKGVGKGVVGLVTRPTSGVIDFASGSLDAVKRVTELSEEVHRLRPPRYFPPDGVVKPYNRYEAEGNTLLKELEKGKFAVTDYYIAHVVVTQDGRAIFLVTDKRLIMISKGEIFGQWNCEWNYTWDELKEAPTEVPNKGLQILLKKTKKKTLGLFGGNLSSKIVEIKDPGVIKWLLGKIDIAMKRNM